MESKFVMPENMKTSPSTVPRKRPASTEHRPEDRVNLCVRTVAVTAMPSGVTRDIHEGLLKSVSLYFKAVLESGVKENEEKVIKLEDTDSSVLLAFQDWLYYRETFPSNLRRSQKPKDFFYKFFLFADMRVIPSLQNVIVEHIIDLERWKDPPSPLYVNMADIWVNTAENSPLRRLTMDIFCTKLSLQKILFQRRDTGESTGINVTKDILAQVPRDLLEDTLYAIMNKNPKRIDDITNGKSRYHVQEAKEDNRTASDPTNG